MHTSFSASMYDFISWSNFVRFTIDSASLFDSCDSWKLRFVTRCVLETVGDDGHAIGMLVSLTVDDDVDVVTVLSLFNDSNSTARSASINFSLKFDLLDSCDNPDSANADTVDAKLSHLLNAPVSVSWLLGLLAQELCEFDEFEPSMVSDETVDWMVTVLVASIINDWSFCGTTTSMSTMSSTALRVFGSDGFDCRLFLRLANDERLRRCFGRGGKWVFRIYLWDKRKTKYAHEFEPPMSMMCFSCWNELQSNWL